jgi:hypothetical protein
MVTSDTVQSPLLQIAAIERFPPELTQYLAKHFLEPSSVTALTLASKHMAITLGTQSWRACRENLGERQALLNLLEKDLPGLVYCHDCVKLHSLEKSRLICRECDILEERTSCWSGSQVGFKLMDVQLAMKRHRQGADNRSNLSGLAQEFTGPAFAEPSYVRHENLQLRIVSDELLVRVQDWMILPDAELIGRIKPIDILGWAKTCIHGAFDYSKSNFLRCRCNHWEQSIECGVCGGLKQCEYCHTEYQLDAKRMGQYVAFVFTSWRNYGSELTRLDPKWKEHSRQWAAEYPWLPEYNSSKKIY